MTTTTTTTTDGDTYLIQGVSGSSSSSDLPPPAVAVEKGNSAPSAPAVIQSPHTTITPTTTSLTTYDTPSIITSSTTATTNANATTTATHDATAVTQIQLSQLVELYYELLHFYPEYGYTESINFSELWAWFTYKSLITVYCTLNEKGEAIEIKDNNIFLDQPIQSPSQLLNNNNNNSNNNNNNNSNSIMKTLLKSYHKTITTLFLFSDLFPVKERAYFNLYRRFKHKLGKQHVSKRDYEIHLYSSSSSSSDSDNSEEEY
jgi:hypothetical protein